MAFDDEDRHAQSEHIVEITQAAHERNVQRRSLAALGVAICLALAAIGITAGIVESQSKQRDAEAAREAVEGWQTLGRVAAANAQNGSASESNEPPPHGVSTAAAPNVIIVNVPLAPTASNAAPGAPGFSPGPRTTEPTTSAAPPAPVPNGVTVMAPGVGMPQLGGSVSSVGTDSGTGSSVMSSNPTPALPSGSVTASTATPALPSATVPAAPPQSLGNGPVMSTVPDAASGLVIAPPAR